MRTVTQPPSRNFIITVATRSVAVRERPRPLTARWRFHSGSPALTFHQWTHMPSCERLNVRKTLIEYMTTITSMEPPV